MNCEKCKIPIDGSYGSGRFCSKACARSRTWTASDKKAKSIVARNSNKIKEMAQRNTTERFKLECPMCHLDFEVRKSGLGRTYCSKACYNADSQLEHRNNGKGGLRKGAGRGKKGTYKGYYCDSSYELVWIVYMIDHQIPFKRNLKGFKYTYEGKDKIYYPDFYSDKEKCYIEIKGYCSKQFQAKLAQFPKTIKVLYLKDLKPYFSYVENKYGQDFVTKLYGQKKPLYKLNKCANCGEPAKNIYCSRVCSGKARFCANFKK